MTIKLTLTTSQQQAIESIDKSILVSAGAGSGKTFVLVQRYVEILQKQPELSVHNILAVTYTRKAAKEMRTRIKARLKELYEQAKEQEGEQSAKVEPMQRSNRWHQCLADMDSANIETIHSFCQSLLRAFTVEIGLNPQLEILDEIERAQLIQDSIAETLRLTLASNNESKAILAHYPLETIETFIKESLNNHLQFEQIAGNWQASNKEVFVKQVGKLLNETQRQLINDLVIDEEWRSAGNFVRSSNFEQNLKLEEVRLQAAQYFSQIEDCLSAMRNGLDEQLANKKVKESWQMLLAIPELGPLRMGGNSDEAKEIRSAIKTLIEKSKDYSQKKKKGFGLPVSLPDNFNEDVQYWELWQALLSITKEAQAIYLNKKKEIGKFDFDDLIRMAKEALAASQSIVRQYYNEKLEHILVDEFQDTNLIQAQIITLLAGNKTKLFLIGDDKQSIYKFQGADVSTFNAWQRKSENNLVFADSFRSQASIVNFVNSVFSVLLHKEQAHVDYRAKYSPLKAQAHSAHNVEIVHLPLDDASNLSEEEREFRSVANWIKTKVKEQAFVLEKTGEKRPINYGDFAILVPRNGDLPGFETCLGQYGIPYVTSGGKTFLSRQEIYDLENMLLFLSNPSNSHALFGVLRSPMFGVSDDIIHNIATITLPPKEQNNLWQKMQDFASNEGNKKSGYQNLYGAISILKRLLADLPTLTLSEFVYRLIKDTNYDLISLSLPDGKQRYKNIWKFYALAKDDYTGAQFVSRLQQARQLSVSEGNAPLDNKHAVKLMTIHAAKGLEFPAVALPVLSSPPRYNKSKLLFHNQYGIVLNTARTEQERDEGVPIPYQLGKTLDDDMDQAEKKRLLYVAMTRARDYLALFFSPEKGANNSAAELLLPLLQNSESDHYTILAANISSPDKNINSDSIADNLLNAQDSLHKQELVHEHALPNTPTLEKGAEWRSNEIERLLEPVLAYLPANPIAPDKDSQLSHRITPSANQKKPSPILLGKYFHKIMQYLPQNESSLSIDKLAALADQFAQEAVHPAFKQSLIEEGQQLLQIYAHSSLEKLFSTARSIQHEWSFYMGTDTERLAINRPDVLLESADGQWYLIDYKTDRFVIADLEQQIQRHRPQLQKYGDALNKLTEIKPHLAIYFAQHGTLHKF